MIKEIMTEEIAIIKTKVILDMANTPSSFFYLEGFPSSNAMGLDPENPVDYAIRECVIEVIMARVESKNVLAILYAHFQPVALLQNYVLELLRKNKFKLQSEMPKYAFPRKNSKHTYMLWMCVC